MAGESKPKSSGSSTRKSAASPSSGQGAVLVPLEGLAGQPDVPLNRPVTTVGANENARLHLVSRTVSKGHAIFVNSNGGTYVADLASRTGVLVNGKLIGDLDLKNGDRVQIGKFVFRFRSPTPPPPARTPPAAAVIMVGSPAKAIRGRVFQIGRREKSDIALPNDATVSSGHAVIFEMDGAWHIRDLGSRTGTLVNGKPIHQQPLNFGDRIVIGASHILFQPGAALEIEPEPEIEPEYTANRAAPVQVEEEEDANPLAEVPSAGARDWKAAFPVEAIPVEPEPVAHSAYVIQSVDSEPVDAQPIEEPTAPAAAEHFETTTSTTPESAAPDPETAEPPEFDFSADDLELAADSQTEVAPADSIILEPEVDEPPFTAALAEPTQEQISTPSSLTSEKPIDLAAEINQPEPAAEEIETTQQPHATSHSATASALDAGTSVDDFVFDPTGEAVDPNAVPDVIFWGDSESVLDTPPPPAATTTSPAPIPPIAGSEPNSVTPIIVPEAPSQPALAAAELDEIALDETAETQVETDSITHTPPVESFGATVAHDEPTIPSPETAESFDSKFAGDVAAEMPLAHFSVSPSASEFNVQPSQLEAEGADELEFPAIVHDAVAEDAAQTEFASTEVAVATIASESPHVFDSVATAPEVFEDLASNSRVTDLLSPVDVDVSMPEILNGHTTIESPTAIHETNGVEHLWNAAPVNVDALTGSASEEPVVAASTVIANEPSFITTAIAPPALEPIPSMEIVESSLETPAEIADQSIDVSPAVDAPTELPAAHAANGVQPVETSVAFPAISVAAHAVTTAVEVVSSTAVANVTEPILALAAVPAALPAGNLAAESSDIFPDETSIHASQIEAPTPLDFEPMSPVDSDVAEFPGSHAADEIADFAETSSETHAIPEAVVDLDQLDQLASASTHESDLLPYSAVEGLDEVPVADATATSELAEATAAAFPNAEAPSEIAAQDANAVVPEHASGFVASTDSVSGDSLDELVPELIEPDPAVAYTPQGGDLSGVSTVDEPPPAESVTQTIDLPVEAAPSAELPAEEVSGSDEAIGFEVNQEMPAAPAVDSTSHDLDFLDFGDEPSAEATVSPAPASTTQTPANPASPAAGPSIFGFQFEGGSFLGGMPISLTGKTLPPPLQGALATPPGAPPPPPTVFDARASTPSGLGEMMAATPQAPPTATPEAFARVQPTAPPAAGRPVTPPTPPRPVRATLASPVGTPTSLSGLVGGTPVIPPTARDLPSPRPGAEQRKPSSSNFARSGTAPRVTEVFSQLSAPIGVEVFGGNAVDPSKVILPETTRDASQALATPTGLPQTLLNAPAPVAALPVLAKKPRRSRLPWLILLIMLLPTAIAMSVFKYMPISSRVVGSLAYDGLATQQPIDMHNFHGAQEQLLQSGDVRLGAMAILEAQGQPPGFTADEDSYSQIVQSQFINFPVAGSTLEFTYNSNDEVAGKAQVLAVLNSLAQQDKKLEDQKKLAQADAAAAKAKVDESAAKILAIRQQRRELLQAAQESPDLSLVTQADLDAAKAKQDWLDAQTLMTNNQKVLADLRSEDPTKAIDIEGDSRVIELKKQLQPLLDQIARIKGVSAIEAGSKSGVGSDIAVGATTQSDGTSNPLLVPLQQQVADLSAKLDARKAELAAEVAIGPDQRSVNLQKEIEDLSVKINTQTQALADAKTAMDQAAANANTIHAKVSNARLAGAKAEDLRNQEENLKADRQHDINEEELKELALARCVTILDAPSVTVPSRTDFRMRIAVCLSGAVFFLLGLMIIGDLRRPKWLNAVPAAAAPLQNPATKLVPWPQPRELAGLESKRQAVPDDAEHTLSA